MEELARGNPDTDLPLGVTTDQYLSFIGRALQLGPHL